MEIMINAKYNNKCSRIFIRSLYPLLAGLAFGLAGMLVDLDHVICILTGHGVYNPQAGEYGCRLWHSYLLPVSGILCGLSFTLAAGLFYYVVYDAIRTTS